MRRRAVTKAENAWYSVCQQVRAIKHKEGIEKSPGDDYGSAEITQHSESGFQAFEDFNGALGNSVKPAKRQAPARSHNIPGVHIAIEQREVLAPCPQRVQRVPEGWPANATSSLVASSERSDERRLKQRTPGHIAVRLYGHCWTSRHIVSLCEYHENCESCSSPSSTPTPTTQPTINTFGRLTRCQQIGTQSTSARSTTASGQ